MIGIQNKEVIEFLVPIPEMRERRIDPGLFQCFVILREGCEFPGPTVLVGSSHPEGLLRLGGENMRPKRMAVQQHKRRKMHVFFDDPRDPSARH